MLPLTFNKVFSPAWLLLTDALVLTLLFLTVCTSHTSALCSHFISHQPALSLLWRAADFRHGPCSVSTYRGEEVGMPLLLISVQTGVPQLFVQALRLWVCACSPGYLQTSW